MINAINILAQTIEPDQNVIFTGYNVLTASSSNGCSGWLNHNEGSGLFQITKPGIYQISFNANVTPTVAGEIVLNISNSGESIAGGEMRTPGTTVGTFENVSAMILVRVPCGGSTTITVKNNTPTNPITLEDASLVITRVA